MPDTTPRKVARLSDIGFAGTAVGAVTTAGAFAFGHLGWHATLIVYLAFICTATVCGVSAVLARCHLSIAHAFRAGYQLGSSGGALPRVEPRPARRARLRAVE